MMEKAQPLKIVLKEMLNAKYIPREYVGKGDLSLNVDLPFIFEGLLPK